MKTIYAITEPIIIEDGLLELVNKAVQKVEELSRENTGKYNWRPSIEIDVPGTANSEQRIGHPSGQLKLQVSYDCGVQDNVRAQVLRALGRQMPTGKISVDLGEYSYEGWESHSDNENLLELPDVYFTRLFIGRIVETFGHNALKLKKVNAEHLPLLAEIVSKYAGKRLSYYVEQQSEIDEIPEQARLFATIFLESHYGWRGYGAEMLRLTKIVAAANHYNARREEAGLQELIDAINYGREDSGAKAAAADGEE